MISREQEFQQAFRNLQLQPLVSQEDARNFRVPYGEELLPELEQIVMDCTENNNQLVFAGHRGCGKSTLLAQFAQQLQDQFFTVFFSISDLIEMVEINHINTLFAIALQLMATAEAQAIAIDPAKKKAIFDWFKKHTRTETDEFEAELEGGFDLFGFFKGKLRTDATVRNEITTEFKQNPRDLLENLNVIAIEIKQITRKEIVVIIDDIDKLDLAQVEEIFQRNIKLLLQPRFIVIYTIPIATIRDGVLKKHIEDETGNRIFLMPVTKLFPRRTPQEPKPLPVETTMETMRSVLARRMNPKLFEDGVVDRIVLYSGGVLRELIRIAQECCRLMRVRLLQKVRRQEPITDDRIDLEILNKALNILRNDLTITLSKTEREILQITYQNHMPDDPKQQEFLDLLHRIAAIEYRNDESWYDVHPLIVDQLRQEGLIP
jgi:nucleoside-triphosphatase THEP1